ncbi:MAG: hypothetical protein ACOCYZ_05600 [Halococcoides sp.]
MTEPTIDELERTILERLAECGECTPAEIALALDADLDRVYEGITRLRERDLLERVGFDTCMLTDDGHAALSAAD